MTRNNSSDGMSTFDLLGDLSSAQRTLTRLFLRHVKLTEITLYAAIDELPENKRLSREETQSSLKKMIEQGWITEIKMDGEVGYTINQQKRTMF